MSPGETCRPNDPAACPVPVWLDGCEIFMPGQMHYVPEKELLLITNAGEWGGREAIQQAKRIIEWLAEKKVAGVLIDCSAVTSPPSILQMYELVEYYDAAGLPRGLKMAVIRPGALIGPGRFQFYETVCYNRGYAVKVFENSAAAEAWLRPDKPA